MNRKIKVIVLVALFCGCLAAALMLSRPVPIEYPQKHVIMISVDGLRSDAITALGPHKLKNIHFLINEGAHTLNARSDYDFTQTLPNHVSMLTSRHALGDYGHQVNVNGVNDKTIHDFAGQYISSIFDVLDKNKFLGAMFVTKEKLDIFKRSYPVKGIFNQVEYLIGHYARAEYNDKKIVKRFLKYFKKKAPNFALLHLSSPDFVGHQYGWGVALDSEYMEAIQSVDELLHDILQVVLDFQIKGHKVDIILTTDHGGDGYAHYDETKMLNYRIPFIVWGSSTSPGVDLYEINSSTRNDPGEGRPDVNALMPPVRNGDGANLALDLLGLESIPDSVINSSQTLRVRE